MMEGMQDTSRSFSLEQHCAKIVNTSKVTTEQETEKRGGKGMKKRKEKKLRDRDRKETEEERRRKVEEPWG